MDSGTGLQGGGGVQPYPAIDFLNVWREGFGGEAEKLVEGVLGIWCLVMNSPSQKGNQRIVLYTMG